MVNRPRRKSEGGWAALAVGCLLVLAGAFPEMVAARSDEAPDLDDFLQDYQSKMGGPAPLFAIRPPFVFTHNVGLLQLQITNIGMIGNFFIDAFSAGWRGGEYLYAAGLWVGAKRSDGVARVSTAVYELEFLPPTDPVWTIYEAFEGIEDGNRLGFSSGPRQFFSDGIGDVLTSGGNDDYVRPNGSNDFQIDEDFFNGIDDDGDSLVDEDFEAVAQQMFSCQYWDISPFARESNPDHVPLELLVQQRSFAWATTGANEFVGFDFKVWNIGNESLNDVFIAFFVDGDAGPKDQDSYWVDDGGGYVSRDTTVIDESVELPVCRERRVDYSIAYMFDFPDDQINEDEGGVRGGDVDGFFGGMFLGHTTDPSGQEAPQQVGIRRAKFFSGAEPYPEGDPRNDVERYDLISGEGFPSRETAKPADFRYVISAGPFRTLPSDTFLTFQTAFVIGEGRDGMIENAVQAQLIFDGVWRDADESPDTGVLGNETCVRPFAGDSGPVFYDSPCDSVIDSTPIAWDGYCKVGNYVDNDCERCTPLTEGNEHLVNWVGTVAPAPPNTNTDGGVGVSTGAQADDALDGIGGVVPPGGDRRVVLQWDNLSELKADPIQRRILFEGYRIWRVEGWQRPVGSTGPAPEEWQLLAQYVRNPTSPNDSCLVANPSTPGDSVLFEFNRKSFLGNFDPEDPEGVLPDDPCDACPTFCWPRRHFYMNEALEPEETGIVTGDTTAGNETADYYSVGRYTYVDTAGVKNGMIYFYDVTAFSAWDDTSFVLVDGTEQTVIRHFELAGRPAAREEQQVVPSWPAQDTKNEVYVVPNPYVQGDRNVQPWGWDLIPSDADPTGTKVMFANLPEGQNSIKIFTLSGDLVQTLEHYAVGDLGSVEWNLVSRNGQDIVSGVYLFTVKTENQGTKVGRFVVIR